MFNRIFWGFVLIGVGILFILDQREIITFDLGQIISTFWPLILIYFGLKGLIFQYKWGQGIGFGYLWPLLLTIFGVYFLGHNIDYIHMSAGDFFQYVIPFILIIIGVLIVLKPGRSKSDPRSNTDDSEFYEEPVKAGESMERPSDEWEAEPYRKDTDAMKSAYTDAEAEASTVQAAETAQWDKSESDGHHKEKTETHFSFIGDIHIGSADWRLKPLNINHFIGDTVIDLTRANIPDGMTKITVGSMIGDVKILLPNDTDVEPSVTMTSVIGEFYVFGKREGGMFKNRREESARYPLAKKQIQIMVNVLIGDFRIERI